MGEASGQHTAPAAADAKMTLADVAAAAQVSIPTASKALRGGPDVAAATRSRVESAMADLGYSLPARQRRRAGLIDLVFTQLSPWATEIIRGAEEPALSAGTRLAVSTASDEGQRERWLDSLTGSRTDEAARQHNLQIPRDLSVIGFDDVDIAQWASPPLTTLRQPLAEMAALATRTLLERNADTFNQRVELATNLVVRQSTAPPHQRAAGARRGARPARELSGGSPG